MAEQESVVLQPIPIGYVEAVWQKILPGLEEALRESGEEVRPQTVLSAVLAGHFFLWIALVGSEYAGFLMTEILRNDTKTWCNIPYAYSVPERSNGVRVAVMEQIEGYARSLGLEGVKFVSSRRGFAKVAPGMGYKERLVEWVKEVH